MPASYLRLCSCLPRNAAVRSHPCSPSVHGQPPTGSPNQSSDHAQPTLSPSLFASATSDASSLLMPCTRRGPEQSREMPPRRGARRGGRGDLAAVEKRCRDLIMQMREQQQPTSPAPAQASVVPQVVPDQLSIEAKHLRDFRKYNPTTFDGSLEDPTKAQMWLSSLETIFRSTTWWETAERMLGGDVGQITWEQFKESFYAKFFSASLRDAKLQKFLNLEFDLRTEKKGWQKPISVPQWNFRSGGELRRFQQKPFEVGEAARGKPLCTTCGKHHLSHCLFGTRTCFKCRQEGHTADRCPMRLTGNAQNQGAVLGHHALVLFDSGSSHSFISSAFVLHARLEVQPLHHVLSVSTPSGECMLSKEKVKACHIEIAGHVIEVTLLVLEMLYFDVILGMDWLATNHASIDCSRKEVVFNPPSMASFKFKREGSRSLPKVISAMRASKLLNQGTWSILASVVDAREVDVSLSSEPVVRDYPDVFPEELPRLPPHREIEFAIELEPGMVPISRPPYRMAPAELKELKVQLQELLGKA
ncbi:gag protease polyprotein [Cucumis melo var. makuwa]|uniref:Gag protease polyprotein n=1 Tax=Cucumis melo var. makuwa TaxID=1194695 RepID=A0A5D3C6K0_CUCMM|nr:gag protease polyprotein [Cucumis melo var. makuwa]